MAGQFSADVGQLAGIGLALTLGFLSFHRFEYRRQIAEVAREQHRVIAFSEEDVPEAFKEGRCYKDLIELCDLTATTRPRSGKIPAASMMAPAWKFWYNTVIFSEVDRGLCIVFGLLSGLAIWLGTIGEVQGWTFAKFVMCGDQFAWFWVVSLTLASTLPPLFWLLGRATVDAARKHCVTCREELQISLNLVARTANPPVGLPVAGTQPEVQQ